ncbi:MAG: amidohydrolase family protein [Gammaproteobacteria bacterium]|nr:amidohydrolase family protein [Gammaproteobacteria bacterium]NIR84454.1 amidohydrolase family protein [Gammaproteobacteria bacterium]NIU05778.1 amidohydrolase family protein [Gammaproteobacteria bacterium]NIX87051.1 amidohydrolase family protein [Gammaproteobacteria bacterium]
MAPRRDNRIVQGLLELAREFDVPMLIHTEASDYRYFLPICRDHPQVRFQWAHAGGHLGPVQVGALMERCPNVWVGLSARDPWRYGSFADEEGRLPPGWRELLERYPERFLIGSDPVWPGFEIHHWDRADTGWERFEQFLGFQRAWLGRLPVSLARRIRLTNAYRFLGLAPPE